MKLNIYGHQPIIAPRDPVLPMEVTTKNYVDTGLANHAADLALHLTSAQNAFLDGITITSAEANTLQGVVSNVQLQLDSKVSKAGDVMTGSLTLSGVPTAALHAAPKSYVDTEAAKLVAKAGSTMTGFLTLHADPTDNMHAVTKQFLDSSISTHANDLALHLTAAQNTWLDSITASAAEVNQLVGVTAPVQTQLDAKFDKAGGTVTGDITLTEGHAVFVSKVPAAPTELVNKAYVDARVQGLEWKDPVSEVNLVSLNTNSLVGGEQVGGVHIVGSAPTGTLTGKEGWPVFIDGDGNAVALKSGAVAVGDRFGVAFGSTLNPLGVALTGKKGTIITITDATPGAIQFTEEVVSAGATTLVFDEQSPLFGNSYSYTDEGTWVLTNTSINLTAGTGVSIAGKAINVNIGGGLTTVGNSVTVKLTGSDALNVDVNGFLTLKTDPDTLTQDGATPTLRVSTAVMDSIADRLSKSAGGTVTGVVDFDSNSSLNIGFTPTNPNQAVHKAYVDSADQAIQSQVTTLQGKVTVLEADPTTKSYVDSQVSQKVNKAGDTMTGFLTLHANPTASMHAVTKQFVDSAITNHADDQALHLTAAQNTWLDEITATSAEVNHLVGVDSPIQDQLDGMVQKAGSVMTGPLILAANPTSVNEAANKNYVDTGLALKANKAGDTFTGFITLHADPSNALHAATKQYVDQGVTAAADAAAAANTTKVNKSGDTMTGFLTLHADPTSTLHAASKQYVDTSYTSLMSYVDTQNTAQNTQITDLTTRVSTLETNPVTKTYVDDGLATKVNKAGDTLTGYLTLHADPQQAMHAVTKQYVDAVAQGLAAKPSVRLATTASLDANYNNGTGGVNSTLTGINNGALVVDGMTVQVNDRILVKAETIKARNGDYVVQQVGNASTPFILKRVSTVDESTEVPGSYFYVFDGATLKGTGWVFVVDNPVTFTMGTDDINVFQFSGQGNIIAGEGLTLVGNTLSVNSANSGRIVVNQDNIDLAVTGVAPGTYTKVVVDGYGRVTSASSPTTIAGYGISDAQPLNTNLTNLSAINSTGILVRDSGNGIATRAIITDGVGIAIANGAGTSSGDIVISTNATAAASTETIVSRDASGNFAANVITAGLNGNASTATALQNSRNFSAAGDVTAEAVGFNGTGNVVLTTVLSNTGVTAGAYTKVTVDAKGRVTLGENPNTVAGMGLIDAATIDMVNAKFDELNEKFEQLYLFVMGRV